MSYQAMKGHEGNWNAYYNCEEPIWKDYVLCDLTIQSSKQGETVGTLKRLVIAKGW